MVWYPLLSFLSLAAFASGFDGLRDVQVPLLQPERRPEFQAPPQDGYEFVSPSLSS